MVRPYPQTEKRGRRVFQRLTPPLTPQALANPGLKRGFARLAQFGGGWIAMSSVLHPLGPHKRLDPVLPTDAGHTVPYSDHLADLPRAVWVVFQPGGR